MNGRSRQGLVDARRVRVPEEEEVGGGEGQELKGERVSRI
jgi:hypothetical protein